MQQYVCVRVIRMDDIDVALFDRDWHNTLYFFIMNADEQIYMRYGGRDAASPDTYLNLDSIELALKKGLELHEEYKQGKLAKAEKPAPKFPREYPLLVERTFKRNACVECHLIGDFQNLHREQDGTLDKLVHLFRSPDIKTIGIHLDVPKGLVVKEAQGAVAEAGMRAGDTIVAVNGTRVYTFGDLQYYYDKTPRMAERAKFTVGREGREVDLDVKLPVRWWWTDLRFRQSSVDPKMYFDSTPLTAAEKSELGLKPDGFASRVKYVSSVAQMMKVHELKVGDIVYAVDGVETDPLANTPELFMQLRRKPGDAALLDVIRDGAKIKMELRTQRMAFRK